MKRALPRTPDGWLLEIRLAIKDAREAKPFGLLIGQRITHANLFHFAPLVCLKFRGRKLTGPEADRVTEVALANFVANSDPDGVDHGLEAKPLLAFALCNVTAHLALDLVNEQEAEEILNFCEDHLVEGLAKMKPCKIWIEQCAAARHIEDEFGTDKALDYLIREKFLNFLEAAETDAELRAEIPAFVAEIKTIFERWQLAEELERARQTEPFDPVLYDDEDEDPEMIEMERQLELERSAIDLLLVERAREWLLEDEGE